MVDPGMHPPTEVSMLNEALRGYSSSESAGISEGS